MTDDASRRRRRLVGALLLAILGALALFGRGAWTPDEPRDLGIAAHMSDPGASWAVPVLGREPFTEKPPLWFWTAAASMRVARRTPAGGRIANLLFDAIALAATALLARRLVGRGGAAPALALMTTSALGLQALAWARVDPALIATSAVGLFGVELALRGATARLRALGALLVHLGIAGGFLAKGVIGPAFPLLALVALAVWERRWRRLVAWPMLAFIALDVALVAPWLIAVRHSGVATIHDFFGAQLGGRAFGGDASYTGGHRRWFGMYLVEWPAYLAPWTLLAICAGVRAVQACKRGDEPAARAARFAIAATVPAFVALSCAATKRDIYLAPILPGVAVAVAGWWMRDGRDTRIERVALRVTAVLCLVAVIAAPVALAVAQRWFPDATMRSGASGGLAAVAVFGVLALVTMRGSDRRALVETAWAMSCMALVLVMLGAGPVIDRSNDFARVAKAAATVAADHRLVLLHPDETLVGALDLYARLTPPVAENVDALAAIIAAPGADVRVLCRRPRDGAAPSADATAACARFGLRVEETIALPQGRAYDLLAPAVAPRDAVTR